MESLKIEQKSPTKCCNLNYSLFTCFYQDIFSFFVNKIKRVIDKDIIMNTLFSCRTAAERYSFSQAYFRKLIAEQKVAFHKFGRSVRFYKSDLDAHFEAKRGV